MREDDLFLKRVDGIINRYNLLHITIGPETRLDEDLGIDSLTLISLSSELEHEFELTISGDALTADNFRTVGSVAELVRKLSAN